MDQVTYEAALREKFGASTLVGEYQGLHQTALHRCPLCTTNMFHAVPDDLLRHRRTNRCWSCVQVQPEAHVSEVVRDLQKAALGMHLVQSFKPGAKKAKFRCSRCSTVSTLMPQLAATKGCPKCKASKRLKTKAIQGEAAAWEQQVVDLLNGGAVRARHAAVPGITYKYKGAARNYYPDVYHAKSNTALDVKHTSTVLQDTSDCKVKARQFIKAGFHYRLFAAHEQYVGAYRLVELPPEWLQWSPNDIERYLETSEANSVLVFSGDPGTSNFGIAAVRVTRAGKIEVIRRGLVRNTIKELKGNIVLAFQNLEEELEAFAGQYGKPDAFIAERYMTRGMKGTTIEAVNLMLGCMLGFTIKHEIEHTQFIPAAQWKNEFNRYHSVEKIYEQAGCTPHECDAVLIGIYKACLLLGKDPYKDVDLKNLGHKIKKADK